MRMTTRRLFGAAALLALSTAGLLGGTASATSDTLDPGDDRAVVAEGNVDVGQPGNACDVVGLPGEEMTLQTGFTVEGTDITITAHPEGYVLTGVVVKGGNAYNVYASEDLGELAWEDLHPPINSSGGPAGISHWFVCAEKDETVTTTTTAPETTTDEVVPTTTDEPAPTTTTTTTDSVAVTPTTTSAPAAVAGASNEGDLANTGYDGGWMLIAGLGLVAAGAAFVASPKLRTLLRR
ncbi:hypothetical protein B0I31_103658 [Saccharothrix carnea]|uniref:LPXTG-motif cell wall-anchored protein n=1 Tax=Saccharothrix carnea TaxID=1280637 RepID=A0A2P8IEJ9_SACCR|nr:hypothetical protein [Saccharothrix carnea]PSL56898.1 hypothetical protein B0I31_103658 [Saccharothrix carnea]